VLQAGIFVAGLTGIAGAAASATTVVAACFAITFWETWGLTVSTVPVQLFAVQCRVTPAIGDPGGQGASTVAVDDIARLTIAWIRSVTAVSIAVCRTVAGTGRIPGGLTTKGVQTADTLFTSTSTASRSGEGIATCIRLRGFALQAAINGT